MPEPSPSPEPDLSPHARELLERALIERAALRAPQGLRQRVLCELVAEALAPGEAPAAAPSVELVSVPFAAPRAFAFAASLAAAIVLLVNAGRWLGEPPEGASAQPEPAADEALSLGERLLGAELGAAQRLSHAELAAVASRSLYPEPPFSAHTRAWQVRRWDDLKSDPTLPATHGFDQGALCVTLEPGQRVLGGFPWAAPGGASPPPTALSAGTRYRLAFRAWASGAPPTDLLIAVGHERLPFSLVAGARIPVSTERRAYGIDFVAAQDDPGVGVAFLASANRASEPTRVCLSDVALSATEAR